MIMNRDKLDTELITFEGTAELNALSEAIAANVASRQGGRRLDALLPLRARNIVRSIAHALPTSRNREEKALSTLSNVTYRALRNHDFGEAGEARLVLAGDESVLAINALRAFAATSPQDTPAYVTQQHQDAMDLAHRFDNES